MTSGINNKNMNLDLRHAPPACPRSARGTVARHDWDAKNGQPRHLWIARNWNVTSKENSLFASSTTTRQPPLSGIYNTAQTRLPARDKMPDQILDDISHRRYNPLRGSWLLVSPHRTKRPWQYDLQMSFNGPANGDSEDSKKHHLKLLSLSTTRRYATCPLLQDSSNYS